MSLALRAAMTYPEFSYLRWAKARPAVRHDLSLSGLPPPHLPELRLGPESVAAMGPDMPEQARAALAAELAEPPERVALTLGTSHALYLVCRALLRPGDRALVERPAYPVLAQLPELCGAEVARFERLAADGYHLPASLCAEVRSLRPKLVLVSNPHNPTGALLEPSELEPLAQATADSGGTLVVDEVYLEFDAQPRERSAARLEPGPVVISSLTKAYGLGNVRFGWLRAEAALVAQALRVNDFMAVLYPSPSAYVGAYALTQLPALRARAMQARERGLACVTEWLATRPRASWHPSEAGIIGLLRLDGVRDSARFCQHLVEHWDTVLAPGDFFEAPGHVRVGFGIEPSLLTAGLERLGAALQRWRE